jgi:hypothetical protein
MIQKMLTKYGLDSCKHSSLPLEANRIVGPDPHPKSREKIIGQLQGLISDSSEAKSPQSRLGQRERDSRPPDDSERQRYMQIVGSHQYVATGSRPDIMMLCCIMLCCIIIGKIFVMSYNAPNEICRKGAEIRSKDKTTQTDLYLVKYKHADWIQRCRLGKL